jgi:hypothetical protein
MLQDFSTLLNISVVLAGISWYKSELCILRCFSRLYNSSVNSGKQPFSTDFGVGKVNMF